MGKIFLVGMGPGDAPHMTPAGKSKRLVQTTRPVSSTTSGLGMDKLRQASISVTIKIKEPSVVQITVLLSFLYLCCFLRFFLILESGTIGSFIII